MIFWNQNKKEKGFTIIELIVSVGVFSVVMVIAAGSLLSVISANRKAQSLKSVLNNLSFAVESMSRSMRVGSIYHCGDKTPFDVVSDCSGNGDNFLAFEASDGDINDPKDQIVYRLENGSIKRSKDGGNSYALVTAPEVVIDNLKFIVRDTDGGNNQQPNIIISVVGHMEINERTRTDFNLQTYVSQRLLNR